MNPILTGVALVVAIVSVADALQARNWTVALDAQAAARSLGGDTMGQPAMKLWRAQGYVAEAGASKGYAFMGGVRPQPMANAGRRMFEPGDPEALTPLNSRLRTRVSFRF